MKSSKNIIKYIEKRSLELDSQIDSSLNPYREPYTNVFNPAHQIYSNQLIAIKEELNTLKEWIENENS